MDRQEVWAFTVAMYGRDGVAKQCLELQDRCGLDVNMLLFMFFLGQKGMAPHSINALETAVRDWRENVIKPLRRVRRHLKGEPRETAQDLRQKVKADELQAERIEQHLLCDAVKPVPCDDPLAPARAYLSPNRFALDQPACDKALADLIRLMGIDHLNES
ncbi:TIGR02444 family protein [Thalassospira sp.]|uniref:TIGR02444 family protein n=1 Tax=Thalassospira sp. TaxID=1912094 RepID=UPI003AA81B38